MKENLHSYPRYMAMIAGIPIVLFTIQFFTISDIPSTIFFLVVGLLYTIGSFMMGKTWPRLRVLWYVIMTLPILGLIWSVYDYLTCTGKFCQIDGIIIGSICALFFITSWLMHCLARFGHKYKSLRIAYLVICVIAITLSVFSFFA